MASPDGQYLSWCHAPESHVLTSDCVFQVAFCAAELLNFLFFFFLVILIGQK